MAEYIKADEVDEIIKFAKTYKNRITGDPIEEIENFINDIPQADVIERSKVDKAIKEIKQNSFFLDDDFGGRKVIDVDDVLKIIESDIGE